MGDDPAMKPGIGVLYGGRSAEHDVSSASVVSVLRALPADRYRVVPIGVARDGRLLVPPRAAVAAAAERSPTGAAIDDRLDVTGEEVRLVPGKAPGQAVVLSVASAEDVLAELDIVLPILHGPYGEDGATQGALELIGVPYVGAGVLGSAVAMDKVMTKLVLTAAGVPVGRWTSRTDTDWREAPDPDRIIGELGLPVFVKPANLGSSVGVARVDDAAQLVHAVEAALQFDDVVIVEAAVQGRELECGVLGGHRPAASVVGEIVLPAGRFYDYEAKYVADVAEIVVPADVPAGVADEVRDLACRAFTAVRCWGMARVDFFSDSVTGELVVNEVNTIPGFTSISMYARLWAASGIAYPDLLERLITLAFERHALSGRRAHGSAA